MKAFNLTMLILGLPLAAASVQAPRGIHPDSPKVCDSCNSWNGIHEPFRVFGNTYYVGVSGLASVLITSNDGHILLDGGLPQSAAMIDGNVRALGFRTEDIRLIVVSHEHFDHVGGIAALQRASGATVAAGSPAARALEQGEPMADDPQYGLGHQAISFPRVPRVRVVGDGEALNVGEFSITAHRTPGHTSGSTTWTWRSCEAKRCMNMVYADSLNPVSADGFRFTAHDGYVALFRQSIAKVRGLPCDIMLSVHPEFSDLEKKVQRRKQGISPDPFIDSNACRSYADRAEKSLDKRLLAEQKMDRPN